MSCAVFSPVTIYCIHSNHQLFNFTLSPSLLPSLSPFPLSLTLHVSLPTLPPALPPSLSLPPSSLSLQIVQLDHLPVRSMPSKTPVIVDVALDHGAKQQLCDTCSSNTTTCQWSTETQRNHYLHRLPRKMSHTSEKKCSIFAAGFIFTPCFSVSAVCKAYVYSA